ncbi:MAG: hypothetical protein ACD_79C01299G0003 [uncultured bacterium]|nr:MAG: hypothetical protein ACD_79C01299G0003 [uncultured bacterium]
MNLKLFISYSHEDENDIKEFIKHISPFKNNGLLNEWHDRKIIPGHDFQDTIDNNLDSADMICLFVSANFLASAACLKEKNKALELRKKSGIAVIPIILSHCGWLDDKEISSILSLPTDGKPITDFSDRNAGWKNVYDGLKSAIEQEIKIRQLKITGKFVEFLSDSELLAKAHSKKTDVCLDDIFISPELKKYNELKEYEKKITFEKLIEEFSNCSKLLIAGENQSGKTTLCKKLFIELRKKNYVPIFVTDKSNQYLGVMGNRIQTAFNEQYENVSFSDINRNRLIPIIDNFHFAKNKEKHIQELSSYCHQILIVDDIFSLNFKDETLTKSFNRYTIKQLSPSLRNELIRKWINLDENKSNNENEIYKDIDSKTDYVNATLGKYFSNGIMPAYPFFILSVISTYETFAKPLNQEITSQGYCYQALIYLYLRKQGVKNDDIGTYINFLSVLAYHFFHENKRELSLDEFESFINEYLKKYNLPVKLEILLQNLQKTKILILDSCNNYCFYYPYLYYFFVAKYLAEHLDQNKIVIEQIINNLHNDENAYIAIFISHHSNNFYVLDEIILNSLCLFDKYIPATLTKNELKFFDEKLDIIVNAVLPPNQATPEMERSRRLKDQDLIEEVHDKDSASVKTTTIDDNNDDAVARDLRRSIKTVEVMGSIIKNRAGSLEKDKLESIFEEAMNIHLRILTSFFDIIKDEKSQDDLVNYITSRLNLIIEDKPKRPNLEQLRKISRDIFWNTNFLVVYGIINKIIDSLGSDKLKDIAQKVCDKNNTPAAFLIKHGILMWYSKNLQIDSILKRINDRDISETAKRIMNFLIVNHCSIHKIDFRMTQKIEKKFNISKHLLKQNVSL